jgi:hypothetical protein
MESARRPDGELTMKNRKRINDGQPDLWCGKARHDKMVGLVETMMTADSLRLTAFGQRTRK